MAERVSIQSIKDGDGQNFPKSGDRVQIHYTGWLERVNGTKFDSSVDRGRPFECQIGVKQVIQAWDEGVMSLSLGQKAILKCPPHTAYGEQGYKPIIPPNSTLFFEVELLKIN
ncbi:uncharacterized protein MELLADRAFT_69051 [Melampsora larici-populina 98AG31]|uniref:peptidylprolyl isomerase n=1 Tax=Melampsora larici-populina (strain 98AG31 / pathotype 3-4-7) TaxID=747676 RepID=F4S982_MELLP|nr:uncharacterized protein MELLADRAFT_69051 [Melampsora larici-populina 98AG31]EGF98774.1 hypothetical protein MELLADRAFT_69051 [Melampsora larici-populina 98AG31]